MSEKATCPGCNSHTSAIAAVLRGDGEPKCPYCGLSASAMLEVIDARRRTNDEVLLERVTSATVKADRLESENIALRAALDRVRRALEEEPEESR